MTLFATVGIGGELAEVEIFRVLLNNTSERFDSVRYPSTDYTSGIITSKIIETLRLRLRAEQSKLTLISR